VADTVNRCDRLAALFRDLRAGDGTLLQRWDTVRYKLQLALQLRDFAPSYSSKFIALARQFEIFLLSKSQDDCKVEIPTVVQKTSNGGVLS
jgi:hypothetical protein